MTQADSNNSITAPVDTTRRFETLKDAEDALIEQGFELVPDTCNWIDDAAQIDAGVYPVEEANGVSKYRIEYRSRHHRVHSAPPMNMPVDTTRRHFLLAVGGGTVAMLGATIPEPLVASDVDPIFSLIEEYRSTAKTLDAAVSEQSRREAILIERGLGLTPFVSILDVSITGSPRPVVAYKHEYIDRYVPADRFSEPNAAAHASLDAQIERHKAILGDSEDVAWEAMNEEAEALEILIWTQPTTIAGTLALLELWGEIVATGRQLDDDHTDNLITSVTEALRDLPQAARS
jgi:hypothetical protein